MTVYVPWSMAHVRISMSSKYRQKHINRLNRCVSRRDYGDLLPNLRAAPLPLPWKSGSNVRVDNSLESKHSWTLHKASDVCYEIYNLYNRKGRTTYQELLKNAWAWLLEAWTFDCVIQLFSWLQSVGLAFCSEFLGAKTQHPRTQTEWTQNEHEQTISASDGYSTQISSAKSEECVIYHEFQCVASTIFQE